MQFVYGVVVAAPSAVLLVAGTGSRPQTWISLGGVGGCSWVEAGCLEESVGREDDAEVLADLELGERDSAALRAAHVHRVCVHLQGDLVALEDGVVGAGVSDLDGECSARGPRIVPLIQWQLQKTWIRVALSMVALEPEACSATRSPAWICASAIGFRCGPWLMRVFEATLRVSVCPFSSGSCGPVQSTPTVSVLEPTPLTCPANQTQMRLLVRQGVVNV